MNTTTVETHPSPNKSRPRTMCETTEQYHIHLFVVTTTHVCKLSLQRISSHTDAIKKGDMIEASYITVHV